MPNDRRYMWRALELARKGRPWVAPNPMVGAVVVKDDEIVGEAWHEAWGKPHAETGALEAAGENAKDATVYVNLEPCCETYEGKVNPPCAPKLIEAGVKRIVIGATDPSPNVNGRGVAMLEKAGIDVTLGECEQEARDLNAAYYIHTERRRPQFVAKWAMTMDGKIATRTGDARWISSDRARKEVQFDRACSGAVIVGVGTAKRDNPRLTARTEVGRQPLRVVVDPKLELPLDSYLVQSAEKSPVLLYSSEASDSERQQVLADKGVYIVLLHPDENGHLSWVDIGQDLGERRITSAIIEGGGGLLATAFRERAIDRVKVFVAPKIFGGEAATTPVEGPGIPDVTRAIRFRDLKTRTVAEDVVIEGNVQYPDNVAPSPSGVWKGYSGD